MNKYENKTFFVSKMLHTMNYFAIFESYPMTMVVNQTKFSILANKSKYLCSIFTKMYIKSSVLLNDIISKQT